jgi:hypothetical protein
MRYSPSLASFLAATSIAFATLAAPTTVLATDGQADRVLLQVTGLELTVPSNSGTWISTPTGRGPNRVDVVEHDSLDGTATRVVVGLAHSTDCERFTARMPRGTTRVHDAQSGATPGLYGDYFVSPTGVMLVCIDTNRGALTIANSAAHDTQSSLPGRAETVANEHGRFIAYVYRAARHTFGIPGVVESTPVAAPVASAAPASAAPAPTIYTAPSGYTLVPISGYGYNPVPPPTSGVGFYATTVGYAPSSQQVLYGMPSAYLPNTQAQISAIHALPERTMPFGFGAGLSLGAAFRAGSYGATDARAVLIMGGRAPSAFEFGVRTVLEYGWDNRGETGEIGVAPYVALHPLALARHYRFDPSLYAAAGYSGIAGMGRNVRLPFTGAVTTTAGVAVDVRVRRGFHVGAYAEIEVVMPTITSGIWQDDAGSFYRASAGIRIMGWGMR